MTQRYSDPYHPGYVTLLISEPDPDGLVVCLGHDGRYRCRPLSVLELVPPEECPRCGAPERDRWSTFCSNCGARLIEAE